MTYPSEPPRPGYNPLPPTPDTSGQFYLGPPPSARRSFPRWALPLVVVLLVVVALLVAAVF